MAFVQVVLRTFRSGLGLNYLYNLSRTFFFGA
jgi:hypothetical protein